MRNTHARSWFSMVAKDDSAAEILIYDEIGAYGLSAKDFSDELKGLGNPANITLRINSPGGDTADGFAIYNMMVRAAQKSRVTVYIDGIACSMASLIAMTGHEIIMPSNALMMIHDPSGIVMGTSKDLRDLARVLDNIKTSMVAAYATRSGQTLDAVAALCADETWFTAQEAVDAGFADTIEQPMQIAAYFDLSKYRNPPDDDEESPGQPRASRASKESEMTKTETQAEMEARLRAELTTSLTASLTPAITAELAAKSKEPVVVPPVVTGTETTAQIEARVRASVTAENDAAKLARAAVDKNIKAMCAIAKKPSKAQGFIDAGKSVDEVMAALAADKSADESTSARSENLLNPHGDHENNGGADLDEVAIYGSYNKKNVEHANRGGRAN